MENLAKRLELKPSQLQEIIEYISSHKPTTKELIAKTGLSNSFVKRLGKALKPYLVGEGSRWVLNKKGKSISFDKKIVLDLKGLEKYRKDVSSDKRELDQFRATTGALINRAEYLAENGDVEGRELVFLGDNDLTSIAIALSGRPKRLVVVDIDPQVLDKISSISKSENLRIETYQYDLRNKLPKKFSNSFDVAFSDPPFTPDGIRLFLQRSLDTVKDNLSSSIYVCHGSSDLSREKSLKIQSLITEANLLILEKRFGFNKYERAESVGSKSDLYYLGFTSKVKKNILRGSVKRIYTSNNFI